MTTCCLDGLTDHLGFLALNVNGMEALDVATRLDVDHGIACRSSLPGAPLVHEQLGTDKLRGALRFSLGPFNTERDIEKALGTLAKIAAAARAR